LSLKSLAAGNTKEPRKQGLAGVKSVCLLPDEQHDLVDHVLGWYMWWQQATEIAPQTPLIALVELFEGVRVASGHAANEFLVVRLARGWGGQGNIHRRGRLGCQWLRVTGCTGHIGLLASGMSTGRMVQLL
jgi:hypothetical protein